MDPVTAFGLVVNILTFIEFTSKVLPGAYDLYVSGRESTKENDQIEKVITDLKDCSLGLSVNAGSASIHEVALQKLAKDCDELCLELITNLSKLKLSKKSKWGALKKSVASQWKKKDIAALEARLGEYRQQMNLRLVAILQDDQSTIKAQLDKVQAAAEKMSSTSANGLQALREDILGLLSPPTATNLGTHGQPSVLFDSLGNIGRKIDELHKATRTTDCETRILEHLWFKEIFAREDLIDNAADGTFDWILESREDGQSPQVSISDADSPEADRSPASSSAEGSDGGDDISRDSSTFRNLIGLSDEMKAARKRLQDWLSSGSGVFHISGKAGAGKSTLMKLLCRHERTKELLRTWSNQKGLVFASFYFWNPGSELQNSLPGLYRSILFHVLRQCPDLIPRVFPTQWKQLYAAQPSSRKLETGHFRESAIKEAFKLLIESSGTYNDVSICLFIDGLDEYHAKAYDHRLLASEISKWTKAYNVKICASSRPHVEFMDGFKEAQRLHLHDLTSRDIMRLACQMFENDPNFLRVKHTYSSLVEEIVKGAEGVFLWAVLVLKSVIAEVGLHSTHARLLGKIHESPRELDDLYDKILGALDPGDRRRANLMLSLVLTCPPQDVVETIEFDWIDDIADPTFPSHKHIRPFHSDEDFSSRLEAATRQVSGLTRGLLVTKEGIVCGRFIPMRFVEIYTGFRIIYHSKASHGTFLHWAISSGQSIYVEEEMKRGGMPRKDENDLEAMSSDPDSSRSSSVILSAAVCSHDTDMCDLLVRAGFSVRHKVALYRDSSMEPTHSGTATVWLVLVSFTVFWKNMATGIKTRPLESVLRRYQGLPTVFGFIYDSHLSDVFAVSLQDFIELASPPNSKTLLGLLPPPPQTLTLPPGFVAELHRYLRKEVEVEGEIAEVKMLSTNPLAMKAYMQQDKDSGTDDPDDRFRWLGTASEGEWLLGHGWQFRVY
ncbi:uncharacterized protein DNG_04217 [Cephalotrichum gorgonifer]|uniref:Nephrocystin 3-like N-terminal domain-containing protein n=1 Tax=Cephalotrichum gorgonifer TaxID=2041049 RepID=A0AAE8SUB7_9PEZI|nr:uncharacterized protein DNG_04217 [Cephalotrichum gorgonifer]